jgi:HK97 family phage portal protein
MRGQDTTAGQTVNETSALNVAAVYTGIGIRCRMLSTLPVDVIEIVDERTRRQAVGHPVRRVLSQPNKHSLRQTKSELIGMLEFHRILRGQGLAWVNRVTRGGELQVEELLPMHPDKVEVTDAPDEFGPTSYKLHRRNGTSMPIPSIEIVHLKNMSSDGRRGRPFMSDLKELIGGALATQDHANSLWSRDATPSVVLKHPKQLSQKAKDGLEETFERTYGRSKDKRRVAVLEEGLDLEQLSLTPNDGQFLETQQDVRAQIAAALMVPPHLMGLAEKATSWGSGIEQQMIGFAVITIGPDAVIWEERLNMDLIKVPEKYQIKFNVRAMLRGDMRSQFDAFWRGIQMGVYSPNDVRALLDMNPIPNGDIYLQPTNMAPLGWDPLAGSSGSGDRA